MDFTADIQRLIFKLCLAFLSCSVLFYFSLFSYGLLYYLYIPAAAHVKPVYLIFDTTCSKGHRCKNPYANVSLTDKSDYELLTRGQIYAIELVLDMPESEKNLNQGMFMIRFDMLSKNGLVLQSSKRPALLHYKSPLFKMLYTLFFAPAMLVGSVEEKQSLTIALFEQFLEYDATYYVYIEIEAQRPEIYSSILKIHAQFTGLRYMMYYWPILSLVIGVGCNFFVVTIIAVFIWIRQEMNCSQDVQRLHLEEECSVDEIRRAIQQKQLETRSDRNVGIQRRTEVPTDLYNIETISPHESEICQSQDFPPVEEMPLSSSSAVRRRTTIQE